jgi:hypothetical protein
MGFHGVLRGGYCAHHKAAAGSVEVVPHAPPLPACGPQAGRGGACCPFGAKS